MRFSNSHAHRVTKIVNGYFSCYFYFYSLFFYYAYISYGRVWMVYLIVVVWFYTRRGKMWNGCGHCGDGDGGSGYKSYFWIIHSRPPTPVRVGARGQNAYIRPQRPTVTTGDSAPDQGLLIYFTVIETKVYNIIYYTYIIRL